MPNYNIMVTAGYKPYTFDELVKPLQMYKEEYDKMEAELQDINDKASLADYYIDKDKDADILKIHQAYMDDLNALADSFTSGGMTAEKRAAAKRLRKRYGSEISNILVAAQERKAEIDEQRKALLANPNLRFSRDAQNTGLSHYYKNPTREAYVPVDLEKLKEEATKLAATVTASYPQTSTIENAYDEKGNVIEGWVTKRTKAGPPDSVEKIFDDMDKNENWDGTSEYKGNYSKYAEIRNSLRRAANLSKFDDTMQEEIKAAIDNGIRQGIINSDKPELVHDPTYSVKEDTKNSTSKKDADNPTSQVPVQRTLTAPRGVIRNEAAQKDVENFSGLSVLPEPAQQERRKLLTDSWSVSPELRKKVQNLEEKVELSFSTKELDNIISDLKSHIAIGELFAHVNDELDKRLQYEIYKNGYDPVIQESLPVQNYYKGTSSGQGSYAQLGSMMNRNTSEAGSNYTQLRKAQLSAQNDLREYKKEYESYVNKYIDELERLSKIVPDSYITTDDKRLSYNDIYNFKSDRAREAMLTDNAETFTLSENVTKQLLPALRSLKPAGKKFSTGLYDLDEKEYVDPENVIGYKEDDEKTKINFSKPVSAGIEYNNGRYDLVLYGPKHKRYAVREIGQFDFGATVGREIVFLTSPSYSNFQLDHAKLSNVVLGKDVNKQKFDELRDSILISPGATVEELEQALGVDIKPDNLALLTLTGATPLYGVRIMTSDGNNIMNIIINSLGYSRKEVAEGRGIIRQMPNGTAEMLLPREQSRTSLVNELASKYLTDLVGNAYVDYSGNKDFMKPNR